MNKRTLAEPYFTLELDGQEIQRFTLARARTTIGRARESEIQIAVRGVSRQHAVVLRDDEGQCSVRDLGSANGTFVNGQRIDRDQKLEVGDIINFLDYALSFRREGVGQPPPRRATHLPSLIPTGPSSDETPLPRIELPETPIETLTGATQALSVPPLQELNIPFEIEVRDSSLGNQIYPLDKQVTSIGGELGSDIHISGRKIEKHHSLLVIFEERLLFVRLSPIHVARVNGTARMVSYLEVGDQISIGSSTIIVKAL